MTSSRSPASSLRFSNYCRTRASTTSGASRLSSGLQPATNSLSRWPERTGGGGEHFHDAPAVVRKEFKALRLKAEQKRALVQRYGLRL